MNIICNNLSANYGKHRVLDNLNFQVKDISMLFISGNNGTGKSLLLKIIAGLETPKTGEIMIDNRLAGSIVPHPCVFNATAAFAETVGLAKFNFCFETWQI